MALNFCPECGTEISEKTDGCINCGYLLKKTKTGKTKIIVLLVAILAILIVSIIFFVSNSNPYAAYTNLLGKSSENLDEDFEKKQNLLAGEIWTASKTLDQLDLPNVSGMLIYTYTTTGFEEYATEPLEIHKMEWRPNHNAITDSVLGDTFEQLESIYDEYDSTKEFDNSSAQYIFEDDDFKAVTYVWNESEFDAYLVVKYSDTTPVSISIIWWNK